MTSPRLTRRELMRAASAAALLQTPCIPAIALDSTEELADIAATKGLTFGCQISSSFFDPKYLHLYQGSVKLVTPENDLKAIRLNPDGARYNFASADRVLDFADNNGIAIHGHTLIWTNGKYNPPWIQQMQPDRVASFIDEYISTIVGHYRGKLVSWDVVNEPTSLGEGSYSAYQSGPFFNAFGPDFINLSLIHISEPTRPY